MGDSSGIGLYSVSSMNIGLNTENELPFVACIVTLEQAKCNLKEHRETENFDHLLREVDDPILDTVTDMLRETVTDHCC